MGSKSRIKPRPEHWALYEQRPYHTAALTAADKWERIGYIALGAVVVAVLGPFVPSRRRRMPDNWTEYNAGLIPSSIIALLLAAGLYNEYIRKPARNHRLGYQLVGRFVVRGKQQVFGSAWLEFDPDDWHRVPIETGVYERFQKDDTVEVVYSATEDLVSVRKIIRPAPTA